MNKNTDNLKTNSDHRTGRACEADRIRMLALGGLIAALTFVLTFSLKIPTFSTHGYVHPGDTAVALAGVLLGPWFGAVAAGLGSALADVAGGYFHYAPVTFLIKAVDAAVVAIIFRNLVRICRSRSRGASNSEADDTSAATTPRLSIGRALAAFVIGAAVGGLLMAGGYFFYEIFLYGVPAAVADLTGNLIQGAFGAVTAAMIFAPLAKIGLGELAELNLKG